MVHGVAIHQTTAILEVSSFSAERGKDALARREQGVKRDDAGDKQLAVSRLQPKASLRFEQYRQEVAGDVNHGQLVGELGFIKQCRVEEKAADANERTSLTPQH